MKQMYFSYSTLNFLHTHSHCWINRMMGIKAEQNASMKKGIDGHEIIQRHVGGIKSDPRIEYLTEQFPIVEPKDKESCKFVFQFMGYDILGFLDGDDPDNKRFLEIKLSSSPWSLKQFKDAVQRKIYALAKPEYTSATLITGSLYPDEWPGKRLKVIQVPLTDKDREEAKIWMKEGIEVFENGDFNGGLDEDGRCTDPRCPWGNNCHFKKI